LEELKKAVELAEDNARFAYVYAISLGKTDPKKAIEILEKAYAKHNGNLQIVSGLAYYYKQTGDAKKSELYEKKLKDLQNFSVR
jgi:spore coat polysaccharide biosynthesis predicted glycosyltransferase SpsG